MGKKPALWWITSLRLWKMVEKRSPILLFRGYSQLNQTVDNLLKSVDKFPDLWKIRSKFPGWSEFQPHGGSSCGMPFLAKNSSPGPTIEYTIKSTSARIINENV